MRQQSASDIDFVITWVDGNDPVWQQQKQKYSPFTQLEGDNGACRYRDWGFLKYWFRAVEMNAPWVRKIHIITNGKRPDSLNTNHPKINFVDHSDYMKAEYLPVFSSRPIEVNMHRIKGLSEQFVYFNDDFFLNRPVRQSDFFRDGKPCYLFHHTQYEKGLANTTANQVPKNCMRLVNKHFTKWDTLSAGPSKMFSPQYGRKVIRNILMLKEKEFQAFPTIHIPVPFLKSTFVDVWNAEPEILETTSSHRFRAADDVTQYLFRFWDLARGNFCPYRPNERDFSINSGCIDECVMDIVNGIHTFICVNDNEQCDNFEECRDKIIKAFQIRYPEKSSYEI